MSAEVRVRADIRHEDSRAVRTAIDVTITLEDEDRAEVRDNVERQRQLDIADALEMMAKELRKLGDGWLQ